MPKNAETIDTTELTVADVLQLVGTNEHHQSEECASEAFWLTPASASEYLTKEIFSKAEVVTLLSGLNPNAAGGYGCSSYLDPVGQGIPAAERMLNDIESGRVGIPMMRQELISWCQQWREYLPESFAEAIRCADQSPCDSAEQSKPPKQNRKNSAESAVAEVVRCMNEALRLIEATRLARDDRKVPGTKAPFRDYLRVHSARLSSLGDDRLNEFLSMAGYEWSQSGTGRGETDTALRKLLDLPKSNAQDASSKVSLATGKLNPLEKFHLTRLP